MKALCAFSALIAGISLAAPAQAKTWYAMINISEDRGATACEGGYFSISTKKPIVLEGPDKITIEHADALTTAWLAHMENRSPTVYYKIGDPALRRVPEVYFRATPDEVMRAFAKDGHLAIPRMCKAKVLVKLPVKSFDFTGFAEPEETAPENEASQERGASPKETDSPSQDWESAALPAH